MFMAGGAFAQHLYLGVGMGANFANQYSNTIGPSESNAINTGFIAGTQLDVAFDSMWMISIQPGYDEEGTNQHFQEPSPEFGSSVTMNGITKTNLNYIDVSVVLKAVLGSGEFRPYAFAGPSFGFFTSGNESTTATGINQGLTETIAKYRDLTDSTIASTDVAVVAGVGISMNAGAGSILFIDAAYAFGFTNLVKGAGNSAVVKSRDIRLAAGILFPLD